MDGDGNIKEQADNFYAKTDKLTETIYTNQAIVTELMLPAKAEEAKVLERINEI